MISCPDGAGAARARAVVRGLLDQATDVRESAMTRAVLIEVISSRQEFLLAYVYKGLIRDIDPDAYTKPKLSASTTETKGPPRRQDEKRRFEGRQCCKKRWA